MIEQTKIKIVDVPTKDLKPAEYNPRRMTSKQKEDLMRGVEKFGLVDPIIVNQHPGRDNIVIGGHQRLKIAQELKFATVPVVYVDLDEAQERELNLRLNKNTGEWNLDLLADFDEGLLLDIGWQQFELEGNFATDAEIDLIKDELIDNQKTDREKGEAKERICPNCGTKL